MARILVVEAMLGKGTNGLTTRMDVVRESKKTSTKVKVTACLKTILQGRKDMLKCS